MQTPRVADRQLCEQVSGYPYLLQFFGAFACGRIGLAHIELNHFARIDPALLHELGLGFFDDRCDGAPPSKQLALEAMARDAGRVTLGRLADVAVHRSGRATYFALVLFSAFVRRRRELTRLGESVNSGAAGGR